jgi:hypothetical protein
MAKGIFEGALSDNAGVAWRLSRLVKARYPKKAVLDALHDPFNLTELVEAGQCEAVVSPDDHGSFHTSWSRAHGLSSRPEVAVMDVKWRGHSLKAIVATWREGFEKESHTTIVADTIEIACEFADAGSRFCNHPDKAILQFTAGCWSKSHELWKAVQASSFDDLVLAGDLKERITSDFTSFLAAKEQFSRYGVPYKRGALLLGPPGNGKTHCLRALIKLLNIPCLYVMSLKSRWGEEDTHIASVFDRAREVTPCCLVFEDLDAMIHPQNRSFFLNQLDGLSNASGIITLATTNHAETLDPAIIDRPSRFDRKYHFELPKVRERERYLRMWNGRVARDLKLAPKELRGVARDTDGYSFAYLKELYLASMMRWMATPNAKSMIGIMTAEQVALRAQMTTAAPTPPAPPPAKATP